MRRLRVGLTILIALTAAGALSGCYYDPYSGAYTAYPPYYGYPYPPPYAYPPPPPAPPPPEAAAPAPNGSTFGGPTPLGPGPAEAGPVQRAPLPPPAE